MVVERHAVITAMGHWFPPHVIGNEFFQSLDIGSSSEWIEARTGIRTRRSVLSPQQIIAIKNSPTALTEIRRAGFRWDIASFTQPAFACLQKRKKVKTFRDEWLVICGTSVPDWDIPANACVIAAKLGLKGVAVDINSACSSFVVNLHFARHMLRTSDSRKVLICNPERYSLRMDYRDRSSCVLFGDGCACSVVEQGGEGLAVIDTEVYSYPPDCDKVVIPDGGTFTQEGKAVQKFAISKTIEAAQAILKRNALTIANIDYFIGHQANHRMLQSVVTKLGLNARQHLFNVVDFGNQGAAGAPDVLSQNWELLRQGDTILMVVVGSGLTWAATILRKI